MNNLSTIDENVYKGSRVCDKEVVKENIMIMRIGNGELAKEMRENKMLERGVITYLLYIK